MKNKIYIYSFNDKNYFFFNLGLLLNAQSNPLFRRVLNIPADTYTEKLSGRRLKINNDIGKLVSHIG